MATNRPASGFSGSHGRTSSMSHQAAQTSEHSHPIHDGPKAEVISPTEPGARLQSPQSSTPSTVVLSPDSQYTPNPPLIVSTGHRYLSSRYHDNLTTSTVHQEATQTSVRPARHTSDLHPTLSNVIYAAQYHDPYRTSDVEYQLTQTSFPQPEPGYAAPERDTSSDAWSELPQFRQNSETQQPASNGFPNTSEPQPSPSGDQGRRTSPVHLSSSQDAPYAHPGPNPLDSRRFTHAASESFPDPQQSQEIPPSRAHSFIPEAFASGNEALPVESHPAPASTAPTPLDTASPRPWTRPSGEGAHQPLRRDPAHRRPARARPSRRSTEETTWSELQDRTPPPPGRLGPALTLLTEAEARVDSPAPPYLNPPAYSSPPLADIPPLRRVVSESARVPQPSTPPVNNVGENILSLTIIHANLW
ncbi:hypothetical protein JAAARDRAFT_307590 [Jaapia argillacea MUCL 33604]|uniref:Uncharacterized protein n=1 Tax=Jaapia argillacea MUCL 33604 TaxID=933084 RepID=A0A067PR54_9AGAM|nr:hypothetical protein JAAARDRAFT_307590 [Jaapia argillacea MUCL 33604]